MPIVLFYHCPIQSLFHPAPIARMHTVILKARILMARKTTSQRLVFSKKQFTPSLKAISNHRVVPISGITISHPSGNHQKSLSKKVYYHSDRR
jgi:hypothetical protein